MPVVVYALPIEHFILWWELEIHSIFIDKLEIDNKNKKYTLLNYKYK
jgi:hypothetical protein